MQLAILLLLLAGCCLGFRDPRLATRPSIQLRRLRMISPKPSGFASTLQGKAALLERTKRLVANSSMIITLPMEGVSKDKIDVLRDWLPPGATASMIKNTIFRKAVNHTAFMPLAETTRDETMYLFIPEGGAKQTYDAIIKWLKEFARTEEQYKPRDAAMEGQLVRKSEVEAYANLPTRKEAMALLVKSLKSVPARLASTLKSIPAKLLRSIEGVRKLKAKEEGVPDS